MLVEEAAQKLGMNTQTLRLALQQKLFPFGVAVKTSEKRYTYYISPTRLEKYIGGVDCEEHHHSHSSWNSSGLDDLHHTIS